MRPTTSGRKKTDGKSNRLRVLAPHKIYIPPEPREDIVAEMAWNLVRLDAARSPGVKGAPRYALRPR
jgi:hypothetical protein